MRYRIQDFLDKGGKSGGGIVLDIFRNKQKNQKNGRREIRWVLLVTTTWIRHCISDGVRNVAFAFEMQTIKHLLYINEPSYGT